MQKFDKTWFAGLLKRGQEASGGKTDDKGGMPAHFRRMQAALEKWWSQLSESEKSRVKFTLAAAGIGAGAGSFTGGKNHRVLGGLTGAALAGGLMYGSPVLSNILSVMAANGDEKALSDLGKLDDQIGEGLRLRDQQKARESVKIPKSVDEGVAPIWTLGAGAGAGLGATTWYGAPRMARRLAGVKSDAELMKAMDDYLGDVGKNNLPGFTRPKTDFEVLKTKYKQNRVGKNPVKYDLSDLMAARELEGSLTSTSGFNKIPWYRAGRRAQARALAQDVAHAYRNQLNIPEGRLRHMKAKPSTRLIGRTAAALSAFSLPLIAAGYLAQGKRKTNAAAIAEQAQFQKDLADYKKNNDSIAQSFARMIGLTPK